MWALLLGSVAVAEPFEIASADEAPEIPLPEPDLDDRPIYFGEVEEGFPAAVGLGAFGFTVCSGSVITPRIVLTAAHCGSDIDLQTVVELGEAFFGTRATEPDDTRRFVDMAIHPDYAELSSGPTSTFLGENDVAVLILAEDAPVEPVWFRTEPLKPRKAEGAEVVSVGFGLTEVSTYFGGEKRSAELTVDVLDPMFLISNSSTNDEGANICSGDSGGPQYHLEDDGTWLQWAVHSWGDATCRVQSGSTRTDVVSDWILDQVEQVHGSRDRCEVNGHYADGVCDEFCDRVDPDCVPHPFTLIAQGEPRGGCATAPGSGAAALLGLLLIRRRRGG